MNKKRRDRAVLGATVALRQLGGGMCECAGLGWKNISTVVEQSLGAISLGVN